MSEEEVKEINYKNQKMPPQTQEGCLELMLQISETVKNGAVTFLKAEYSYLALFCLVFATLIYLTVDMPIGWGAYTTVAFLIGAATSMLCGLIGMRIAVYTNVRTTYSCNESIDKGF